MICLMRVFTYGADLFEAFDEKFYQKKNIRTRNTARTGIVNMNAKTKQTEIHLFPGYIQCNMLLLSVWGTEETEYQQLSLQRKMLTCSTWLINKLLICCIICWMLPFAYSNMLWMCVYCSFFFPLLLRYDQSGVQREWKIGNPLCFVKSYGLNVLQAKRPYGITTATTASVIRWFVISYRNSVWRVEM